MFLPWRTIFFFLIKENSSVNNFTHLLCNCVVIHLFNSMKKINQEISSNQRKFSLIFSNAQICLIQRNFYLIHRNFVLGCCFIFHKMLSFLETNNHTSKINVFPVLNTIFSTGGRGGVKKLICLTCRGQLPASRKKNFNTCFYEKKICSL